MSVHKRIALLVGQPEENYQKLLIEGFLREAFSYNYDVCIFAMYQKCPESPARRVGESTIFSLVRYQDYDAVVLLLDTIQVPGLAEKLEKQIKAEFTGPVVCIDKESQFFPSVRMNHYPFAKKVVTHLIEEHGYRDIAYLTGVKDHPHSGQRLQGFLDAMAEHHLSVGEDRIFYGDFWYPSGELLAEHFLKNKEHMPEAIACANDYMAIGLAKGLTEGGMRIPEDVAIIGYDSVKEGQSSPKPITSLLLPTDAFGVYIARYVKAMLEGEKIADFQADAELFVGSSCGCHNESVEVRLAFRERWGTEISEETFYSHMNHMSEDLMLASDMNSLLSTIYSYVSQIQGFESFHLCLNEWWANVEDMMSYEERKLYYTERMCHALQCSVRENAENGIYFDDLFDAAVLLPDLFNEKEETPKAYIFTPLHFEDRCFGYAALSYGSQAKSYAPIYRLWLRNVIQGLECFYRMAVMLKNWNLVQSGQMYDSLTGFYNYNGLMEQTDSIIFQELEEDCKVSVLVADISNLTGMNDSLGREEGNKVIKAVAQLLKQCTGGGWQCCLGNGEFAAAILEDEKEEKVQAVKDHLLEEIQLYNETEERGYQLSIYTGMKTSRVESREELAGLINEAVSCKNGNKLSGQKLWDKKELTLEERKEAEIVRGILDKNLFSYHFQPIVRAHDGEIFAYEALMRVKAEPYLSPLKVLKYAGYFGRLLDVEKATFFNVLDYVENHWADFERKKIFINSIPGSRMKGADALAIRPHLKECFGMVVVEFTEQAEMEDEDLAELKGNFALNQVEIAVDDYGTGYSNVANLLRYMPNYVKIDRMLISEIQNSPQKQHFVKDIIAFAHDNDIMALAEGVETTEELMTVINLGADLIQGYYVGMPEAVPAKEISLQVRDEILRYNQEEAEKKRRHVYTVGKDSRVSLANLASRRISVVEITGRDSTNENICIVGVPGFVANIQIQIGEGYCGNITLSEVTLTGKRNKPCIELAEGCEVNLILDGSNELQTGGILVPEGAKLTVLGEGNMKVYGNAACGYGIGNGFDASCGEVTMNQDGAVDVFAEGSRVVGIGAGLGGKIHIKSGKYVLRTKGRESVALGMLDADIKLKVENCDIETYIVGSRGVCIGSLNGSSDVEMTALLGKGSLIGDYMVGIGSLSGKLNRAYLHHASADWYLKGKEVCGVGSLKGASEIVIDNMSVSAKVEGDHALAFGNQAAEGKLSISMGDINTEVTNALDRDLGAEEIQIVGGKSRFLHNGKEVVRQEKVS